MSDRTDKPGTRLCPICGKPAEEEFRPFCGKRCADTDLNRWLSGGYVIPGAEEEDTEDTPKTAPEL